ncbi:GNAT family N-acetyltransferase, partial [bacterium]|nr:GNAT family N-acetyltransferase [bacterium]
MSIRSKRLLIKPAEISDAGTIVNLWNDPDIMTQVGFPEGLGVSDDDICSKLQSKPAGMLDFILSVRLAESGCTIGQAIMHAPTTDGIGSTDIKLLKKYQGKGFGSEVKQALIDYLFENTSCHAVEGSPNLSNTASIRMQEAVGAIRIGRGKCQFQSGMKLKTAPVDYWI